MAILSHEQWEALRAYDTPTICNAIELLGIRGATEGFTRPGMRLRTSQTMPIAGQAVTCEVSASEPGGDQSGRLLTEYYEVLHDSDNPVIAVVKDTDPQPIGSFWGEVQASCHMALGAVGTLTDGGVRDIPEVDRLDFYMFSTEILVSHAYIHMNSFRRPVDILGLRVYPGALLHADCHGAVLIPAEAASVLADACRRVAEAEQAILAPCRGYIERGIKPEVAELMMWRAKAFALRKAISG